MFPITLVKQFKAELKLPKLQLTISKTYAAKIVTVIQPIMEEPAK